MDDLESKHKTTLEHNFVNESNKSEDMRKFPAHWERYAFAEKMVSNKKVLDVACGSGYGTDILTKASKTRATGLDIDPGSIEWAKHYFGKNSDFSQIKGNEWPIKAESIDVVVSFETIEHAEDPRAFILEAKRVLKAGGLLIISTPLNETEERFNPQNPFHLREYSWEEFGALISGQLKILKRFSHVSNLGALNSTINKSFFHKFKKIIPNFLRKKIANALLLSRKAKAGNIIDGFIAGASVQIITAEKMRV